MPLSRWQQLQGLSRWVTKDELKAWEVMKKQSELKASNSAAAVVPLDKRENAAQLETEVLQGVLLKSNYSSTRIVPRIGAVGNQLVNGSW